MAVQYLCMGGIGKKLPRMWRSSGPLNASTRRKMGRNDGGEAKF